MYYCDFLWISLYMQHKILFFFGSIPNFVKQNSSIISYIYVYVFGVLMLHLVKNNNSSLENNKIICQRALVSCYISKISLDQVARGRMLGFRMFAQKIWIFGSSLYFVNIQIKCGLLYPLQFGFQLAIQQIFIEHIFTLIADAWLKMSCYFGKMLKRHLASIFETKLVILIWQTHAHPHFTHFKKTLNYTIKSLFSVGSCLTQKQITMLCYVPSQI